MQGEQARRRRRPDDVGVMRSAIRQVLQWTGLIGPVRWLRYPYVRGDIESRFSRIYASKEWQGFGAEVPSSGEGSSLSATENVRAQLPGILRELGAETLLDIGCGDLTWISQIELPCRYIGVDVVKSLIERHSAAHPEKTFLHLNAVSDELPPADVVLCREIIFHLSFADAKALFANIGRTPARYLIATTDRSTSSNRDLPTGLFRPINLERAPFGMGHPLTTMRDDGVMSGRLLGVWRIASD